MKILVTGGAGFIGSHLVDALIKRKHRVVVVDDLSVGLRRNVNPKARFIKLAVQDKKLKTVFSSNKFDFVFHLAAQKNLQVSKEEPMHDAETNIMGGINVIESVQKYKCKKIVFYSSAAIYDAFANPPNYENDVPQPITPYGIAKLSIERYIEHSGICYTNLRPSNVYGSRQDAYGEGGVVAIFCSNLARAKQSKIFNTGRQTRDFIYVDDVVAATIACMRHGHNQTINISTNRETSVNKLYATLVKIADTSQRPRRGIYLEEQQRSALNNSRAKRVLHWKPKKQLNQGLTKTYHWFHEQYEKKIT